MLYSVSMPASSVCTTQEVLVVLLCEMEDSYVFLCRVNCRHEEFFPRGLKCGDEIGQFWCDPPDLGSVLNVHPIVLAHQETDVQEFITKCGDAKGSIGHFRDWPVCKRRQCKDYLINCPVSKKLFSLYEHNLMCTIAGDRCQINSRIITLHVATCSCMLGYSLARTPCLDSCKAVR